MPAYIVIKIKQEEPVDLEKCPLGTIDMRTFSAGATQPEIISLSVMAVTMSMFIEQMISFNETPEEITQENYQKFVDHCLKMPEATRKHLTHEELDKILQLNEKCQEEPDENQT